MARHPLRHLLSQLLLQLRIITAVARRELEMRAAKGLFGVVGVFLEPLVLIGTFLALRILLRGAGEGSYMNLVLWLSMGFVPFFLFAEVAIKAISGVEKNSTLYFYRRLRPLDSLMGNALLTTQIFGLLLLVITLAVTLWEWHPQVAAHGVELLRQSVNPAYPVPGINGMYFWAWVIGSLGFGLFIYGNNEELLYSTDPLPGSSVDDED
jgi:ABC-type polysaccharide/polyol phosphate export permease